MDGNITRRDVLKGAGLAAICSALPITFLTKLAMGADSVEFVSVESIALYLRRNDWVKCLGIPNDTFRKVKDWLNPGCWEYRGLTTNGFENIMISGVPVVPCDRVINFKSTSEAKEHLRRIHANS